MRHSLGDMINRHLSHSSGLSLGAEPLTVTPVWDTKFQWSVNFLRSQSQWAVEKESESEVAQSCLTLCDPMVCSLPDSSIHGISQAAVLEWVSIAFSRGFSRPRDWTEVSHIVGRRFTVWAMGNGTRLQIQVSARLSDKVYHLESVPWAEKQGS